MWKEGIDTFEAHTWMRHGHGSHVNADVKASFHIDTSSSASFHIDSRVKGNFASFHVRPRMK